MQERIRETLAAVIVASEQPNAHRFLPHVAKSLQAMEDLDKPDCTSLVRAAGALGRIVTDDFAFSESPLGQRLLDLITDIVAECDQQDIASNYR